MKNAHLSRLSLFAIILGSLAFAAIAQQGQNEQLNGSYRLEKSTSDDVARIVRSIEDSNNLSAAQVEELEDQLTPAERVTIRIGRNNSDVTLSTSASPEMTFRADGSTQSVAQSDGSYVNISASLRNGRLRLSKVGGDSSYSITFSAENGGLRVTRMVTTNYLDQTVYADSAYTRESYSDLGSTDNNDQDDDDSYSSSDPDDVPGTNAPGGNNYPRTRTAGGKFHVPNGVVLSGTLDNKITTKASQNNDRFTITIDSPYEFDGAVVEGYLSGVKRTGRVTGSSRLTFNFETIRLRSGEVYDFAGNLKSVTDSTGKVIKIGDEGDAKSNSKTKESIKRGGIGAGIGAIIGGILGGAKGAIIGATIGGGAGAGSVIAQGKDDIELLPGSQIEVESSSPNTDIR